MQVIDLDYEARAQGFQAWVENSLQTEVCTAASFRYHNDIARFVDSYTTIMSPQVRILASAAQRRDFELAPFIYTGIYKKHAFEACSAAQHKFEYIALSSGLVMQLINLYRTLLASAAYLDGYGNSQQEMVSAERLRHSLLPEAGSTAFLTPICPQRGELAMILTTTALSFIWGHEDEHLLFGHDLLHAASSENDGYLFQSLELAADRRALHHSRTVFFNFARTSPPLSQFPPAKQEAIWLSSLVLMFLWLDIAPHNEPSHPSPHLRLANLAHHFTHAGKNADAQRENLFNQTTKNILRLWQALAMPRHTIGTLALEDTMKTLLVLHSVEHLNAERIDLARAARRDQRKQRADAILAKQPKDPAPPVP